jgi:hypothetical protein
MRFYVLAGAVVALIAAYSAFWWSVAAAVPQGIDAWAARERARGREVDLPPVEVGGYPFAISVRLPRVAYGMPDAKGAPRYAADAVTVMARPWNLRHLVARIDGAQTLSWVPTPDAPRREARVEAERAMASVVSRDDRVRRIAVDLTAPRLDLTGAPGPVTASRLKVHFQVPDAPAEPPSGSNPTAPVTLALAVEAEAIKLPAGDDLVLGPEIARIGIGLGLTGPMPPDGSRAAVAAWRDAGGTLELQHFDLAWGRLAADGTGTLALDEAMRPLGALSFKMAGWEALVDQAVAWRALDAKGGGIAKTALGLLAVGTSDERGRLPVPLTFQDGRILLGPAPVGRVEPLF